MPRRVWVQVCVPRDFDRDGEGVASTSYEDCVGVEVGTPGWYVSDLATELDCDGGLPWDATYLKLDQLIVNIM